MTAPRTLYDKIWDDHVAHEAEDGTCRLISRNGKHFTRFGRLVV